MTQPRITYAPPPLVKKQSTVITTGKFKVINKTISQPKLHQLTPQHKTVKQAVINYTKPTPLTATEQAKVYAIHGIGTGKALIIIGNGPSIAEIDTSRLKTLTRAHTMSINKPDPRIWPTTYWAFCDISQYNRHLDYWEHYTGTIITGSFLRQTRDNLIKIRSLGGKGFSYNLIDGFYLGRSTVFANMQTALWMGYDIIYILGCDMAASPDGRMWNYGINPDVSPEQRAHRFEHEASFYQYAANILPPEIRHKYIFCSSYNNWPFIKSYNSLAHETAIDSIIQNYQ